LASRASPDRCEGPALIRIDRLPENATGLKLAESSPDPGDSVHSIGNPGKSGALRLGSESKYWSMLSGGMSPADDPVELGAFCPGTDPGFFRRY